MPSIYLATDTIIQQLKIMELSCKDIAKIFYLGLEKIGVSSLFAIVGGSIGGYNLGNGFVKK